MSYKIQIAVRSTPSDDGFDVWEDYVPHGYDVLICDLVADATAIIRRELQGVRSRVVKIP
jgi:hypothetical protein